MSRNTMLVSAIVSIAAIIAVGACGDDDDGGGSDPCADAAQVQTDAVSAYCADKTDYCCYCQCWESSYGLYDSQTYMDDQTCTCSDPPDADTAECDGDNLDDANNCLADEAACGEAAVEPAELVCEASPL